MSMQAAVSSSPAPARKPILCLDFDGVIHSYSSGWKGAAIIPDPPVPGAMAFLLTAIDHFDVHVFSSRSNQSGGIDAMRDFIDRHLTAHLIEREKLAPIVAIDTADSVAYHQIKFPEAKPPAHLTIDDRAVTFDGTWPDLEALLAFKPWNKR